MTESIETSEGLVKGFVKDEMHQFLGIPYAAPPVGNLRWRPPQTHMKWRIPLEAVSFGNVAAQNNMSFPGFGYNSENEDCLYLNVFVPEKRKTGINYPVMIWIPGGGLIMGASNGFDPSALVKNGEVIFVSMNYRLGVFGFLSHPAINAEGHAHGNYGIMDQQFALKWVNKNIANFGGDPSNVTIFGESAGGICVWTHIASPCSANLFHKAIVMSGTFVPTTETPSLESRQEVGQALATAAGCINQTAENLRLITTSDLLAADAQPPGTFGIGRFQTGVMVDGKIIPESMLKLFSTGQINRVSIINGTCHDEFRWFQGMMELSTGRELTPDRYLQALEESFKSFIPNNSFGSNTANRKMAEILAQYPLAKYASPSIALAAAVGDCVFISNGGRRVNRLIKKFVDNIYAFEFDVPDSPSPWPMASFPYESAHTIELQYIFPGFCGGHGISRELSKEQKRLSSQMVHYWSTFAYFSTPNAPVPDAPLWSLYDPILDNYLSLRIPNPCMITTFNKDHQCDFWDSLIED